MLEEDDQVHHPPIRDAATLKNVLYGPGHEKFPSWPIAAAAEAPIATRAPPTGTSQRSKSWTDHTNYPKENVIAYTRPYMRRTHPHQLKTVLEHCDKNPQEQIDYLTRMDRIEKQIENNIPSPPVRDSNPNKKMQDYEKLLEDQSLLRYSYDMLSKENPTSLTQADLEEYTRTCDEINIQHQQQPSYAQSEGYHSYVSSTDSTSTPFLDRLTRDIDTNVLRGSSNSWDHDSIVTTSSGSASSSETLKWRGSLSDVSVASSSFNVGRQQLIAHSARVQTPQRHNSESVLYIENNRNDYPSNHSRSHYASSNCTGSQLAEPQSNNSLNHSPPSPQRTVAERIHQFEKQNTKYTYLDPDKKTKVSDPALKAIQKKALLLYYERHQNQSKGSWRSEPKLNIKLSQSNPIEMDLSSDSVHSQNNNKTLKSKSQTDCEPSVQNKSKRLPCSLDFKAQQQFPISSKPEQHKSYKSTFREINEPIRDQVVPSISPLTYDYTSPQNASDTIAKKQVKQVISKPIINYDDPLRRLSSKTGSKIIPREFNNHERRPSMDLIHFVQPSIMSDPPLTSENENSDLQGPIIMGNSISIDDWVPERPPKNQELLRSVYPDLYKDKSRYHSPELPLPSPPLPICDDENVCLMDEPFPPPPLEIIDEWKYQQEVLDMKPLPDVLHYNKHSTPESQKPGKYAVKDTGIIEELNANGSVSNFISTAPPTKPKPMKREYPSQSKINIASRRNSFANAQDISKDFTSFAANMRASVREKTNQFSSSKLVMSAQRQLYRSVTVDQSPAIPKKPINPFLRSTSMKHDVEHNKDIVSHNNINFEKSKVRPDRINHQYQQHNQKSPISGPHLLPTSDRSSNLSGHYRAEPMWIMQPVLDVKNQEIRNACHDNINPAWRQTETRRVSLPNKPMDEYMQSMGRHEYQRNASFDGSDLSKTYSFCETDIENIPTKTADVRSTNLDNIVKIPSLQWTNPSKPLKAIHQPEHNLRRQSATAGLHTEHEKGSPDVNIGSYKKINVPIEKHFINSDIKDTKDLKSHIITNEQFPTKDVAVLEQHNPVFSDVKEKNISLPAETESPADGKSLQIIEHTPPDFDTEVSLICEQKHTSISDTSLSDEEILSKPTTRIPKLEKLKPRTLLAEEDIWELLRPRLITRLQLDTPLMNLISQYEEYNATIESITNVFELDMAVVMKPKCEDSQNNDTEGEHLKENEESIEKNKKIEVLKERLETLLSDFEDNKNDNFENTKTSISKCLQSLVSALSAEGIRLEQASCVNEGVGVNLLATASKSARLSRHAADVGRVSALISGLVTRLARATRPLKLTGLTPERRKMLIAKQEKLADQLEEAKKLKESIDARGLSLSDTLSAQVRDEFKDQYTRFIATKIKLVVYSKDVQYRLDLAKQIIDAFLQDNSVLTKDNNSEARTNELL